MKEKEYRIVSFVVGVMAGVSVYYLSISGLMFLSVIPVLAGMFVLYFLKGKTEDVLEDEMLHRISEKASMRTLQVFLVCGGLVSLYLISFTSGNLNFIGHILSYTVIILLILYFLFYIFYNKTGLK
ncbi:MAG: DUF2178 domain-containing protein [Candidatus Micrarchaeota archaeon]|nr:DUF2178 domain-containing protein [Candidatus Micrarchaeota archaeon]